MFLFQNHVLSHPSYHGNQKRGKKNIIYLYGDISEGPSFVCFLLVILTMPAYFLPKIFANNISHSYVAMTPWSPWQPKI